MKLRCPRCQGHGKIELASLSDHRRKFLEKMAELGPSTIAQIHKVCGGKTILNATYRQIERLEAMGLVRKVGSGLPAKWKVG